MKAEGLPPAPDQSAGQALVPRGAHGGEARPCGYGMLMTGHLHRGSGLGEGAAAGGRRQLTLWGMIATHWQLPHRPMQAFLYNMMLPPPPPPPGVVKQDKASRGSVDTTKTRSGPQRVRMGSGERPMGAAKGKQPDTEALCQPPPPPHTHTTPP